MCKLFSGRVKYQIQNGLHIWTANKLKAICYLADKNSKLEEQNKNSDIEPLKRRTLKLLRSWVSLTADNTWT
jgi:hypothetical protein